MTRVTNIHGLPSPLVEAIINDDYDRGDVDISVTGLLNPPRISALAEKYADDLVEDVSERIWLLLGKSVHATIERTSSYGISEERMFTECNGWKVSGQFDHLSLHTESGRTTLYDWKVTSVWTLVYGEGRIREWEEQLNLYALLLHDVKGIDVDNLEIIAILRDWQQSKAKEDGDGGNYPAQAVRAIPLSLWTIDEQRAFMAERVQLHQAARQKLPLCSDEDRWAKPTKYAVYGYTKAGTRKVRADRVFDDYSSALDLASRTGGEVEERRGDQWTRCKAYCPVAAYCDQFMEGSN